MKRIISPALVVLFLLFLLPREQGFAREEYKFDLGSLKWEMTKGGVPKTDLGPGLPEVAILKVSNEVFEKIHASEADALKYLEGQHIFKRKLIKVVFCDVKAYDDGNGWFLIIPHTPLSTAFIIAWQIPKNPKKMKEK